MDEDAATGDAPRGDAPPLERLSNWRIAVLALYSLGGATQRQHQEDIAVKCHELAPRRFSWERYAFPNLDIVGKALRDAKHRKNGELIAGDKRIGWLLTPDGIDWASSNTHVASDSMTSGASVLGAAEDRELRQLKSHRLFEAFIKILQDEWAYGRFYASNAERLADLPVFLSEYNHARPHGGIGGAVPASRL